MAQFNADILLSVKGAEKINAEIAKIEQKLDKVAAKSNPFSASGARKNNGKELTRVERKLLESQKRRLVVGNAIAKQNRNVTSGLQKQSALLNKIVSGEKLAAKAAKERAAATNKGGGGGMNSLGAGIGFPLLFGGGLGSIGGGALGSLTGGFGSQILFSAIGGIIDQSVAELGKLGQALNPLTADVGLLAKSAGLSGTAVEKLIQDLDGAGLSAEALALATAELEQVVGKEGVEALKDFGEQFQAFTSDLAIALTKLQAFAADLFNNVVDGGAGKIQSQGERIAGARNDVRTTSPVLEAIGDLDAARGVEARLAAQEKVIAALDQELSLRQDNVAAQIESAEAAERQAQAEEKRVEKAVQTLITNTQDFRLLEAQLVAAEAGVDLADDKVYLARQAVIERQFENDLINAGTNAQAAENAEIKKKLALKNLENSRDSALTRGVESAPKSKALQLEQQITQEELKQTDLTIKRLALSRGEKAALQTRINLAQAKVDSEVKIVELQRQQALESNKVADDVALINAKYDAQLQTLLLRNQLDKENYQQRLKALALEEKMTVVKGTRAVDDLSRGMNRQLEDISTQMANPFGGDQLERLQLETQQYRESTDQIRKYEEAITDLQARQVVDPKNQDIATQIQTQQKLLSTYRELSPAIFEAQQQQLKLNQTMEKLQPITNAIASGMSAAITGVIDGTKTVEEAMSEMFASIGKAFIDMATQMIAKALVMKALNILMPGAAAPTPAMPKFGPGFEGGGYTGNAPRTGGMDGRGGFPAILHPQETVVDHTQAMGRYSAGNASSAGAMAPMTANVTYSGPTLNFNGDDYIPRSEANALVAAGAKQGQARTMSSLKNSRSQRSRLGM